MNYIKKGDYDWKQINLDANKLLDALGGTFQQRKAQIMRKAKQEMFIYKLGLNIFVRKDKMFNAVSAYLSRIGYKAEIDNGVGIVKDNNDNIVAHFHRGTRACKCTKDFFIYDDKRFNTMIFHHSKASFDFLDLIRNNELLVQ